MIYKLKALLSVRLPTTITWVSITTALNLLVHRLGLFYRARDARGKRRRAGGAKGESTCGPSLVAARRRSCAARHGRPSSASGWSGVVRQPAGSSGREREEAPLHLLSSFVCFVSRLYGPGSAYGWALTGP
jgi:hypothetical protein